MEDRASAPAPDPRSIVVDFIRAILDRRAADDVAVEADSDLHEDLDLDSLELAELSAFLEDELGSDPYTAGQAPRTVGDVIAFYNPTAA